MSLFALKESESGGVLVSSHPGVNKFVFPHIYGGGKFPSPDSNMTKQLWVRKMNFSEVKTPKKEKFKIRSSNSVPARSLCRVLFAVIVFVVVVCPQSTALVGPGHLAGSAGGRRSCWSLLPWSFSCYGSWWCDSTRDAMLSRCGIQSVLYMCCERSSCRPHHYS